MRDVTFNEDDQGGWIRMVALVVGMGALLAASLYLASCNAFFGFAFYDDEGFLLLSLRQYVRGAILYDELYSQYGPAYFEVMRRLAALGFDFTHTSGRVLTVAVWAASSVLCAITTYRLTRSVAVALCAQALVFEVLTPTSHEPMHPGGLLCLVLAGAVTLVGTFVGNRGGTAAAAVLGGLIAVAALTKANVGGLALLSAVYALTAATDGRWRRLALVAGGAMVLAPAALTAAGWEQAWVRALAALVAASAGAVVLRGLDSPKRGPAACGDRAAGRVSGRQYPFLRRAASAGEPASPGSFTEWCSAPLATRPSSCPPRP